MSKPEKTKVFIADFNDEFREQLSSCIELQEDMVLAGTAGDGEAAFEQISEKRPDVLIADLLLSRCDGVALLRRLEQHGIMPATLVVSAFYNDNTAAQLRYSNVFSFIPKPCNVQELMQRVREAAAHSAHDGANVSGSRREAEIGKALLSYGIMPNLIGYRLLSEAIKSYMGDPGVLWGVTKILYPDLAHKFGTTAAGVERAMRSAIESAWSGGNDEQRNEYFSELADCLPALKSNCKFIRMVGDTVLAKTRWSE